MEHPSVIRDKWLMYIDLQRLMLKRARVFQIFIGIHEKDTSEKRARLPRYGSGKAGGGGIGGEGDLRTQGEWAAAGGNRSGMLY
jgi:hypothetical protein